MSSQPSNRRDNAIGPSELTHTGAVRLKLWIDADAAPRDMKEVVFRAASRLDLPVVLVANQTMYMPPGNPRASLVVVRFGANIADKYIVAHADPGDIAITADIPLAAELIAKGVRVINPRGEEYNESSMPSRLAARNLFDAARGAGMETRGPEPYSDKDRQAFAQSLDRVLTKAIRAALNQQAKPLP